MAALFVAVVIPFPLAQWLYFRKHRTPEWRRRFYLGLCLHCGTAHAGSPCGGDVE